MQRWEKLPEGQPSLQRSTDLGFKAEWPDGSHRIITLKHSAETTQRWLRDNSVNVLEWPNQSPDLNLMEHLWRDLRMAVHQQCPSNLTELEMICREGWQKISKSTCAKLVASYPRKLEAVIAANGAERSEYLCLR